MAKITPQTGGKIAYGGLVNLLAKGLKKFSPSWAADTVLQMGLEDYFGPHTPSNLPLTVLKKMALDETVHATMRARKAILMTASLKVKLRQKDEVLQQFLQDRLDGLRWDLLSKGLNSLKFGFVGCELIWSNRRTEVEYLSEEGTRKRFLQNAFIIDEVRDRDPQETTLLADSSGDLAAIQVDDTVKRGVQKIVFTHNMQFGNARGRAASVPAYYPWTWGNRLRADMVNFFHYKGDPPYKMSAPSAEAWAARIIEQLGSTVDFDGIDLDYIDPIEFAASVVAELTSGGIAAIPSEVWTTDDGIATGSRMFDLQPLDIPDKEEEFAKAIELTDVLKARACLGNAIVGQLADLGQAGSKQGARMFHTIVRPDIEEYWAPQVLRQYLIPLALANFDLDLSPGDIRLEVGPLNENKMELLIQLIGKISDATHFLPDGRKFKIGTIVDIQRLLSEAGVPVLDEDVVALDDKEEGDSEEAGDEEDGDEQGPTDPGGRPRGRTGDRPEFNSDDPDVRAERQQGA